MVRVGTEYMVAKTVGLGLQLHSVMTTYKAPKGMYLNSNERYGFDRLGLTAGIRFYF